LRRRNCSFYETIPCCDGSLCNQFMEDHNTATFPSKKQELLQAREKHKEEQVIALKQSMQSGMFHGDHAFMTNINVNYELLWLSGMRYAWEEHHLGDMNKQLRLKLEAEGFNLKPMKSLWSSTSVAANSNFTFQPSQTNNPMDCQPEPFLQIGLKNRWLKKKTISSEDCLGWAARDESGHLSPYKFNRRDRLPQSDIHS
ncbi:hypothetical protein S245_060211, partial [Arachis hypogaea]